jgi:hypothetical protein
MGVCELLFGIPARIGNAVVLQVRGGVGVEGDKPVFLLGLINIW